MDVEYFGHDSVTSIIKTTIIGHYTIFFNVKINCKLQSDTEPPFTMGLGKTPNDSPNLTKEHFNLNHILGNFLDECFGDDDLKEDFIKFKVL